MKKLVVLFALLAGCSTYDHNRAVKVDSEILPFNTKINTLVNKLYSLDAKSSPVVIMLDSLGGEVTSGNMIIKAIEHLKSKGVTVKCIVTGSVMSMAANIYLHCSERMATPIATFMWHRAKIFGPFGPVPPESLPAAARAHLDALNKLIFDELRTYLPASKENIQKIMDEERIMTVKGLQEILAGPFFSVIAPDQDLMDLVTDATILDLK